MIKLISLLKETLAEAKFGDIAVWPAKDIQRGTSEAGATSFNINIGNPDIIRKMAKTPMGKAGSATSFKYDGPEGDTYKEFKWDADTSQWTVWKNMNYLILTPKHYTHWYHGKMPGGSYTDDDGKLIPGSTGTPLPDLTIEKFGYKVYKALLLEPSVGFIKSEKSSTPAVKKSVYANLMKDNDLVWISAGGKGELDYDELLVMNPSHVDVKKLTAEFEEEHNGAKFFYSKNFPKS